MRHIIPFGSLCLLLLQTTALQAQADAGPDQYICLDTTSMHANLPLGTDTAYWTLLTGSATIVDPSDPSTLLTDIVIGQNTFLWTVITALDTTTDQVNINKVEADPGIANAGPDQTIYAPPFETMMMATTPVFPQVCTWTVVQGQGAISDPNGPHTTVNSLGVGENIFQWTCDDGPCSTFVNADQVMITVELGTSVGMIARGGPLALWFDNNAGLLHLNGDPQPNSLTIVNAIGQQLPTRADHSAATVDLSDLPSGCYTSTAIFSGERRTLRFVVNR